MNTPETEDIELGRLLREADPVYNGPPLRLEVTAAQLRERQRPARSRWGMAAIAAAGTATVVIGMAWALDRPGAQPITTVWQEPTPAVLVLSSPDGRDPASAWLRELAARTRILPDAFPTARPVTELAYRAWSAGGAVEEVRVWRARDGRVRQQRTTAGGGLPSTQDFPPDEYQVAVPDPAAGPEILAGQLHFHQDKTGVTSMAASIADLFRDHCLTSAQRAAALRVLADTEGVTLRGHAVDRDGRAGVVVSVDSDSDSVTHLLVIDPATGHLLSYEQVTQLGAATSPVRTPAQLSYVVYLDCGTLDRMP